MMINYFLTLQTWHMEQHNFSFFNQGNQAICYSWQVLRPLALVFKCCHTPIISCFLGCFQNIVVHPFFVSLAIRFTFFSTEGFKASDIFYFENHFHYLFWDYSSSDIFLSASTGNPGPLSRRKSNLMLIAAFFILDSTRKSQGAS